MFKVVKAFHFLKEIKKETTGADESGLKGFFQNSEMLVGQLEQDEKNAVFYSQFSLIAFYQNDLAFREQRRALLQPFP